MRKKLLNSIDELDMENLTPSDYCLQGHYMKFESYTQESMEKEVREFFNQEYDGLGDKIAQAIHTFAGVADKVLGTKLEHKARGCSSCNRRRNALNSLS